MFRQVISILAFLFCSCFAQAQSFSNSDVYFNTTNARGHSVLFVNTATGLGTTTQHTNSWGDVVPLIPFTYGYATSNADYILLDIPSGLPSNTTHLFLTGSAIVTSNVAVQKHAFFYLFTKPQSSTWYTPGPIMTGSANYGHGDRDTTGMIVVPVENGQYMLRWGQHIAQGYYQSHLEAHGYGFNLTLAGYAVPKTAGVPGTGLTEAEVNALIDIKLNTITAETTINVGE